MKIVFLILIIIGYGGQDVSLALNWTHSEEFRAAGYEPLIVNDTYTGGQTRQYGNLSFTRIYESGHESKLYTIILSTLTLTKTS